MQGVVNLYPNLYSIAEELACPLCKKPLFDPIQTSCCHAFCRQCICTYFEENNFCPKCHKTTNINEIQEVPKMLIDILAKVRIQCLTCGDVMTRDEKSHKCNISSNNSLVRKLNKTTDKSKTVSPANRGRPIKCADSVPQDVLENRPPRVSRRGKNRRKRDANQTLSDQPPRKLGRPKKAHNKTKNSTQNNAEEPSLTGNGAVADAKLLSISRQYETRSTDEIMIPPPIAEIFKNVNMFLYGCRLHSKTGELLPINKLKQMITSRGGKVATSKVYIKKIVYDYLITAKDYIESMTKAEKNFIKDNNIKVVNVDFIVDSCVQGQLLDWRFYKVQVNQELNVSIIDLNVDYDEQSVGNE